jgi:hypothetical protein
MSSCTCQKCDVGQRGSHSECTVSAGSESHGRVVEVFVLLPYSFTEGCMSPDP